MKGYGIFSRAGETPRAGYRVDESVHDVSQLIRGQTLNEFLAGGRSLWEDTQGEIETILRAGSDPTALDSVQLHMPFDVADYVDFYSSEEHATNLGKILRPGQEPLLPNWRHLPIGYHGRAGTVVVSGTEIVRPSGQRKPPDADTPTFGPTQKLDIELELGFVVGTPSTQGKPVPIAEALDHVFGAVLVNDWSARDIQAWEYQPLGPFLGKSFATSISPWVVPLSDLPRVPAPPQDPEPLDYLRTEPWAYDIDLDSRAQRRDDLQHEHAAPVLERRAAGRAPDLERREPAHGRPPGQRHDLGIRPRLVRQPDRADLERRAPTRARRRLQTHLPRGRRRGRSPLTDPR